jgi:hypothetical protein
MPHWEKPENLELGYEPLWKRVVPATSLNRTRPPELKPTTCDSLFPNRGRKPLGNLCGAAKTSLNDAAPVSMKGNRPSGANRRMDQQFGEPLR